MIDPLVAHSHINPLSSTVATDTDDNAVQNLNAATTVTRAEKTQNAEQETTTANRPKWQAAAYENNEQESSSLDKALEQLNSSMQPWATGLRFDVDPDTQRIVLTLVDNESGDVIRTVPSEAVLAVAKMITQFQGNGINTKA